jgi:hypothetical protein
MANGRPKKFEIKLTANDHDSLEQIAQSRSMPHGVVRRAQMILLSAQGQPNSVLRRLCSF